MEKEVLMLANNCFIAVIEYEKNLKKYAFKDYSRFIELNAKGVSRTGDERSEMMAVRRSTQKMHYDAANIKVCVTDYTSRDPMSFMRLSGADVETLHRALQGIKEAVANEFITVENQLTNEEYI